MTIVQLIKAEIERLKVEMIKHGNSFPDKWACGALDNLLSFINSIQKEHASKDFEAALATEWKDYVDSGAETVDALEDNTQELAFSKGFYRGAQGKEERLLAKACEWLKENLFVSDTEYDYLVGLKRCGSIEECINEFKKYIEGQL